MSDTQRILEEAAAWHAASSTAPSKSSSVFSLFMIFSSGSIMAANRVRDPACCQDRTVFMI